MRDLLSGSLLPETSAISFRIRRILNEHPFQPPQWLRSAQLQTIFASQAKRDFFWGWQKSEEMYVDLADGSRIKAVCAWQPRPSPTLLAVHGIGGSSDSSYMLGLSHKAFHEGWNAVLLNFYNFNSRLEHPRIFHAGSSKELEEILSNLLYDDRIREVFLVGVSMGGNIVLKMLGEWGRKFLPSVRAAAVISPLVDLMVSWQRLEKPSNCLFRSHFVKNLKRLVRKHVSSLNQFVDTDGLRRVRTVRQYDEVVTAPLCGFRDAFEYYEKASALPFCKEVCVPTLVIHSRDDPLIPFEPLINSEIVSNPRVLVHLTERGGHAGFLQKRTSVDIDCRWAENRVIDFFRLDEVLQS